ncbi:MAG TPA: hypothetical protein DCO86_04785 [Spirochaetaceae bacterium]|nr:hypothetical protein [Spirochaetaceae bacterium]
MKGTRKLVSIRIIACALLLSVFAMPAFSATKLPDYEPYAEDEFPDWMKKLRRAEVITLGATAMTYPIIGLFTDFDDSQMEGFWLKFGVSAAAGALIALADYIIGEVHDASKGSASDSDAIIVLDPESDEASSLDMMKSANAIDVESQSSSGPVQSR